MDLSKSSESSHLSLSYLLPTLALSLGLLLGYFLFSYFPSQRPASAGKITEVSSAVSLPTDAVLLEQCEVNKGTVYIRPSDIPHGPLYLVSNGEVIGVEYRLDQDSVSKTDPSQFPSSGVKSDHVQFQYLPFGSKLYQKPYYSLVLYKVKPEVEQNISCPKDLQSESNKATDSARSL